MEERGRERRTVIQSEGKWGGLHHMPLQRKNLRKVLKGASSISAQETGSVEQTDTLGLCYMF